MSYFIGEWACQDFTYDETHDYIITIVEPNTTYQWKVIPKNSFGSAADCDTWTFTSGEDLNYCDSYLYDGDTYSDPCD